MEKNLTTGSVFKTIVYFSLPYLLSYFLQTLYGMADLFIIGQFKGVDSTTAVSIGSQIMHMITVMIVGLAVGSTVIIGRLTGAGDKKQISTAIGNTVTLFIGISLILMAVLLTLVNPIVDIMSTPEEAIAETIKYLKICFIGIPFSYLASKHFANTLFPMGLAAPAGSLLSAIICFVVFIWLNKKNNKNLKST